MKNIGENIISCQMPGLTIGGIAWGIIDDKKGRRQFVRISSLFGMTAFIYFLFIG
jgi:hypothetical protein